MRRFHPTKLLRFLLAAVVALASVGPQAVYSHSHPVEGDGHHDHAGHDGAAHDDHDDDHDGPSLSDSIAHVHGSWLGFAITRPATEGSAASESRLSAPCPALSADLVKGLFGPLKERVPWPEFFVPPEPLRTLCPRRSPLPKSPPRRGQDLVRPRGPYARPPLLKSPPRLLP